VAGLILLQGVPFVMRLGLTMAVRSLLAGDRLCWVDGVNAFDPYAVARLAKRAGRSPKELLARVYVSRAFTCYQLHALVVGRLPRAVSELPADGVVAVGLGATFHDDEVPVTEATALFDEVVRGLERLVAQGVPVLVVNPYLPQDYREPRFAQALARAAGVVLAVDPAEDGLALRVSHPLPGAGTRTEQIKARGRRQPEAYRPSPPLAGLGARKGMPTTDRRLVAEGRPLRAPAERVVRRLLARH
jgi:hypothetical protein